MCNILLHYMILLLFMQMLLNHSCATRQMCDCDTHTGKKICQDCAHRQHDRIQFSFVLELTITYNYAKMSILSSIFIT